MKESDFQSKFTRWLKYEWPVEENAAFELKMTKGKSLPFDAVKAHQLAGLRVAGIGLNYKIPDDTFSQKPFDCFHLYGGGYVVVMFWEPGVKHFYIIPVCAWELEVESSDRKSLTEERAMIIGKKHTLKS